MHDEVGRFGKLSNAFLPHAGNHAAAVSLHYFVYNFIPHAEQRMDLRTYFQLFWVPAIASVALMALLWAQDGLSGRAPLFLASWFLLALAAQYLGTITSVLWVVGLALQTALATFLLLKHRLGQL